MMTEHLSERLRCALCRRGLLSDYTVYALSGGVPQVVGTVKGCFYRKGERHVAEVIAVAGNIPGRSGSYCRLIVFDWSGGTGRLVKVGEEYYRVTQARDVASVCMVLELEVFPYAGQD